MNAWISTTRLKLHSHRSKCEPRSTCVGQRQTMRFLVITSYTLWMLGTASGLGLHTKKGFRLFIFAKLLERIVCIRDTLRNLGVTRP
jgi:hypothetical protein